MEYVFSNAYVYKQKGFVKTNIFVCNDIISKIGSDISPLSKAVSFDFSNSYIFPGFVDVHVHLREPGFSYKETVKTGTLAAAHGGYTAVCPMPNLKPAPDNRENLDLQLDIISKDACINVYPYATITKGELGTELSDFEGLHSDAIGFSDDGRGVQDDDMMYKAMLEAKKYDKLIVAHCEDNSLLHGGYIHAGEYAKLHGHKGICSESEWKPIERDLRLAARTGCKYHVCHISTKESVALIRDAKKAGIDVTCETAPHYLILCDKDLQEDGRFKMNPPLRSEADRQALIEGICDGTIDMIATDHAPHSTEEKSKGLQSSAMGVVGLETAFAELYTGLVRKSVITLEDLIELMSINPRKRFKIDEDFAEGKKADLCVFNLENKYTIDSAEFLSKGRATPFDKDEVYGKCLLTMVNGRIVWKEN